MFVTFVLTDDCLQIAEGLRLLQVAGRLVEASEDILLKLLPAHTHDGRGIATLQIKQCQEGDAYHNTDTPDITSFHTRKIKCFMN